MPQRKCPSGRHPFLRTRRDRLTLVMALLVQITLSCVAARGEAQPPSADAAFEAGRAAMESGDFSTACQHFAESLRLEPAVGTQLNLGECYERLGRYASALHAFEAGATAAEA